LREAINAHLVEERISICRRRAGGKRFRCARMCRIRRHYRYVVANRRATAGVERAGMARQETAPMRRPMPRSGAGALIGHTTSRPFATRNAQANSPLRTLRLFRNRGERTGVSPSMSEPDPFCIDRCVRWLVRSSRSATANGRPTTFRGAGEAADRRPPAGPVAPPDGAISGGGWSIPTAGEMSRAPLGPRAFRPAAGGPRPAVPAGAAPRLHSWPEIELQYRSYTRDQRFEIPRGAACSSIPCMPRSTAQLTTGQNIS